MPDIEICPLDPRRKDLVELVARRMRETLIEVLGEPRGRDMYSMEWLQNRVLWHLDEAQCRGQVFLAKDRHADEHEFDSHDFVGHTIVRLETSESGEPFGLFSTTFVVPMLRRIGLASRLLDAGEAWMRAQGLQRAATATSKTNAKLIQLFEQRGYEVELTTSEMLRLSKALDCP